MTDVVQVEVVYAEPERAPLVRIELPQGSSVGQAQQAVASRLHTAVPLAEMAVGIFGEVVSRDRILADQDRVEFYRPLHRSAKEARLMRADIQAEAERLK